MLLKLQRWKVWEHTSVSVVLLVLEGSRLVVLEVLVFDLGKGDHDAGLCGKRAEVYSVEICRWQRMGKSMQPLRSQMVDRRVLPGVRRKCCVVVDTVGTELQGLFRSCKKLL